MLTLTRRDAVTRMTAFAAALPFIGTFASQEAVIVNADPRSDYLPGNIAHLWEHIETLADPDIREIDDTFFIGADENPTARAAWELWDAAYAALKAAIDRDAPHLRPLLDRMGDAGGDIGAASEAAGRDRGIALTCALHPERVYPLDISTWEAFQMFPLPGSVPDADAVSAAVIERERIARAESD